jgi:hypothetical protein
VIGIVAFAEEWRGNTFFAPSQNQGNRQSLEKLITVNILKTTVNGRAFYFSLFYFKQKQNPLSELL